MVNLDDPEDRLVAAGEFVLGTLSPQEAETVLSRISSDPAFAAMVGYWQDRLLPLAAGVSPVEPSPAVLRRIEAAVASLPRAPAGTPTAAPDTPVAAPAASPMAAPLVRPRETRAPVWQRLGWWRALGTVAVAASLVLAVLLVRQTAVPAAPAYLATLQTSDGRAGWIVQASADGPILLVPLVPQGQPPAGRAWQFWTKPEGASAPTSLGLVPSGSTLQVARRALPALEDEQLFEITLEPATGSPTGRPTGPILYIGKGRRI